MSLAVTPFRRSSSQRGSAAAQTSSGIVAASLQLEAAELAGPRRGVVASLGAGQGVRIPVEVIRDVVVLAVLTARVGLSHGAPRGSAPVTCSAHRECPWSPR